MAIGGGKFSNTTAGAAVGQWRQFSGAMQQLQESKGAMTQVVAPKFEPERFNLAGSLLDVMEGANDAYDNIKKVADKNAQEWANGKSFQEVANEMKENKVPFQYDPFAMASLATIQGRNAFNIGMMEFNDRLKTDEFIDMSPEEIDQVFIDHQRKVATDLGEAHGSLGSSGAFLNGFWVDANKTREYVWKTSETVKDDFRKQQGQIAAESQINELLDGSVDDLHNGLTMLMQSGVAGRMPEDAMKVAKSTIEAIANHPDGFLKIDQLADKNVPGLSGGITYRMLFGDETINATKVKSNNIRMIQDFTNNKQLDEQISSLVLNNDIGGLRALQQTLADQAGGQVTKATEKVQSAIDAYNKKLTKDVGKATALMKDQIRIGTLASYTTSLLAGLADPTTSPAGNQLFAADGTSLGTPSHEHLQEILRQHFMSGQLSPDMVDRMLTDKDGQKMFKSLFGEIAGQVKSDIEAVASGFKTPDSIREPDGLKQVLSYINNDPRKVSGIVDYEQADALDIIGFMASGGTFGEYVNASAMFKKKSVRERFDLELPIKTRTAEEDNSAYETLFIRRLALVKLASGKDSATAIKEAKHDFKATHQQFTYQSPHKDKGLIWDSSRDEVETYIPTSFYQQFPPEMSIDDVNKSLTDFIASIEAKFEEKDLYFEYDPLSKGVRVYEPGIINGSYLFTKDSIVSTTNNTN